MDVFDLVAKLTLDTSEYDKSLGESESNASSFGSTFGSIMGAVGTAAGVAGVAVTAIGGAVVGTTSALTNAVSGVAEYGDNIDKMSQKMGISIETYQEWDAVMQHSGTSMETMKASMKTLANAVENGNKAFETLGLTQEQLAEMSQEQIFEATIAGLQNVTDTTQRTYLAGQLLGRGATELGALLNTSAEDTQAMRDRVRELGGVMSEDAVKSAAQFQDNLQDLQTALTGVKRGILSELLPSFNDLMDGFTKLISGEEGADEALLSGFDKLIDGAGNIAERVLDIGSEIVPRMITGVVSKLPDFFNALAEAGSTLAPALLETLSNDVIPTIMDSIPGIIESYSESLPEMIMTSMDLMTTLLPMLIDLMVQLLTAFANTYEEMAPILSPMGVELLMTIVNAILKNLPLILDAAVAIMTGMVKGIVSMMPELVSAAVQIVMQLVATIIELVPHIIAAAVHIITEFLTTIVTTAMKFLTGDYWKGMLDGIVKTFTDIDWAGLGKMLTEGIANGIKDGFNKVKDSITNVANGIKNIFTNIFDIHSPSKLFEFYGEMIDEGLAKGIGSGLSINATKDMSENVSQSFTPSLAAAGIGGDIVIPVSIGNEMIQTIVVDALNIANYRSGGR